MSAAAAASLRDQFGEEETESLGLAGVESDDERAESDDCEWEGSTCEEPRAWQAQPPGAGAGACGDAGASGAGSSLPDDVTHMRASAASGTAASDASADEPGRCSTYRGAPSSVRRCVWRIGVNGKGAAPAAGRPAA